MFLLSNKIYGVFRDQLAVSCLITLHLSSLKIVCPCSRLGWIGKSSLIQQNFRTNFKKWGFEYCKFHKAYAKENSLFLSYFPWSSSWLTKYQGSWTFKYEYLSRERRKEKYFLNKLLRNVNIVHIFIMVINFFCFFMETQCNWKMLFPMALKQRPIGWALTIRIKVLQPWIYIKEPWKRERYWGLGDYSLGK